MIEQQDLTTIKDSLTICHFTHSISPSLTFDDCLKVTEAIWDKPVSKEELQNVARRIWILKRMFNIREFEPKDPREFDKLPKRFMTEPLPSGRAKGSRAFASVEDFEKSLDALYEKRGLDKKGRPIKEELERLSLEF